MEVERFKARKELALIRSRGYALTCGQRVPGAVGVGAPVRTAGGAVIGAVYLSIPQQRFSADRKQELVRALIDAADKLAGEISGP